MAFKVHKHDKHYFHASGNNGDFKIAKKGLSPKQHAKYLAMCEGGTVPKLAEGGEVDWATGEGPTQGQVNREAAGMTNAAGKTVAGFAAPAADTLGSAAVAGIRSVLPGGRSYEQEMEAYGRDAGRRSVVHPPLTTPQEHAKWMADPQNPDTQAAMETAMNFIGGTKAVKGAKAAAEGAKRTRVGLIPWDEMNLPEAVQAARDRAHLFQLGSGHYIGAPPSVKDPAKLGAMRGKIDKAVERGAFGADWYERARAAIAEISHNDPKTADRLSALLANYSPQATPDSNFGWAIQQANRSALEGPAASALNPPKTKVQAKKGAKILADEPLDLGPKAGVYEQHINPNKADEAMVRGVNDLWQGRVFGYPPGKDKSVGSGLSAKAGFSDAQHSFMTGENLLAAERAKAKGLIPQVETPNVGNVQAASWVGQRYNQLLAKEAAAAKKAKAAGKPFKAKTDEEIRRKAMQSYDTVLDKYTAHEPHTTAPAGLGPEEARAWDRQMAWAKPGEADPFYRALGMPARPTEVTSTGFNARPVVSFTKGNPNKGGIGVPEQTMIENVNRLRTVLDEQGQGNFHALRRAGSGQNAAAVRFPQPLTEEGVLALREQAQAAGLDIQDLGGGAFTLSGDLGTMPAKDFTARMKSFMQEPLAGARVETGRYIPGQEGGAYAPAWYEGQGSGVVTKDLLERMDPRVAAKIDADPVLRELIGGRVDKLAKLSAEHGVDLRADVQRLRSMISGEGIQGLKEYVAKNGYKGLPAIVPFLLMDEGVETHAQGGIVGEGQGEETGGLELQAEDEHYVHFIHPDGHRLSAAKAGLSPETLERFRGVKKYAEGGDVSLPVGMEPQNFTPLPNQTPAEPPPLSPEEQGAALRAAWGQEPGIDAVQPRGGQAPAAPATEAAPVESTEFTGRAAAEGETPFGLNAVWQGLKSDVGQGLKDWGTAADAMFPSNIGSKVFTPAGERLQASAAQGSTPEVPAQQGVPQYLARSQPEAPRAPAQQYAGPAMPQVPTLKPWGTGAAGEIASASKEAQAGIKAKAKVEEDFFLQMQQVQNEGVAESRVMFEKAKARYEKRQVEMDRMYEEVKNAKIDPNRFLDSKDTGQKILAGIGMLFSGMGSGLTGQPNMAMDVINRAIDRDIDAQKFNIHKNQNALSWYAQQTGNELQASSLLRAQLLDMVAGKIEGLKLGMNAATVAPAAQIASGQLRMQAAQLRQQVALQDLQGQQIQFDLRMKQYQMQMMQSMIGAGPGAGAQGNHTEFLRRGVMTGVFPMDKMAKEVVREPIIGPDGRPMIGPDGNVALKPPVETIRMFNDPERAREAQHVFTTAPTLKAAVQKIQSILRSNPSGTNWLQNPEANAMLKTEMAHVLVAYETMVNGMKRQPNAETIEVIKNATSTPGAITSSILGTSMASMETIMRQTDAMLNAYRESAWY